MRFLLSIGLGLALATLTSSYTLQATPPLASIFIPAISKISGTVTLPGSKSLSNRILLLSALSHPFPSSPSTPITISNLLASDDIKYMLEALLTLGFDIDDNRSTSGTVNVYGRGGTIPISAQLQSQSKPQPVVDLFLGNAGTAMRPLAAVLALAANPSKLEYNLDGIERMRERPIVDLIDALKQLGANASCISTTGCPPVTTTQPSSPYSNSCTISGKISSQFLSSLLMAAPLISESHPTTITISDELISAPYVLLTIGLMKKFGVDVDVQGDINGRPTFLVPAGSKYSPPEGNRILVEGDASSASYFLGGAAIAGCGEHDEGVTVVGCGSGSVQGDVAFANCLEKMGCDVTWTPDSITVRRDITTPLRGGDFDCGAIPDAAMTLAAIALYASGPTTIRNVGSWRVKETERMKAIVAETSKFGAKVEEFDDYCIITPPHMNGGVVADGVEVETYDDHRMAMTFSLVACGGTGVTILDPGCTGKTFPTYFEFLDSVSSRS